MRQIKNVTITDRAMPVLVRELLACRPRAEEVRGMVYVTTYKDRHGDTVEGFLPGYMVGPWQEALLSQRWVLADIQGVAPFHFLPRSRWTDESGFVLDLLAPTSAMFSITSG